MFERVDSISVRAFENRLSEILSELKKYYRENGQIIFDYMKKDSHFNHILKEINVLIGPEKEENKAEKSDDSALSSRSEHILLHALLKRISKA